MRPESNQYPLTSENYGSPQERPLFSRRQKIVGTIGCVAAIAVGFNGGAYLANKKIEADSHATATAPETETVYVHPELDMVDHPDIYVLQVDDSNNGADHSYTASLLEDSFNSAGKDISTETFGARSLNVARVDLKKAAPDDINESGEACFSGDYIKRIEQDYFESLDNDNAGVAVVMQDTRACSNGGAYASNTKDGERSMTVYQPNMIVDGVKGLPLPLIAHEQGHAWGLGHMTDVACKEHKYVNHVNGVKESKLREYSGNPHYVYDVDSIANCGPIRKVNDNTEVDNYASDASVMGTKKDLDYGVYSVVDLNSLDSKKFPLTKIDTTAQTVSISVEDGENRGVVIDLPADHPLKEMDSEIEQVVIGPELYSWDPDGIEKTKRYVDDETTWSMRAFAVGKDGLNYRLDTMSENFLASADFIDRADKDFLENSSEYAERPVYIDESLGIVISGGRDADSREMYVKVENTNQATDKVKEARKKADDNNYLYYKNFGNTDN